MQIKSPTHAQKQQKLKQQIGASTTKTANQQSKRSKQTEPHNEIQNSKRHPTTTARNDAYKQ